ncbi:VCBS domain-containing protein [Bradyrhizobium sp. JYMT SZCCT0428]|nr:VCBS domain-containing protein [Bradyrhizobium sp. JYMT SZCCT0428]
MDDGAVLNVTSVSATSANSGTLKVTHINGLLISEFDTVVLASGASVTLTNGVLVYDPTTSAFVGLSHGEKSVENFDYAVSDDLGGSATTSITVNLVGTNDAPVATGDSLDAIQLEDAGFYFNSANGHWYRFEGVAKNWFDARDAATVAGGYLATVTTAQENQFIWDHIDAGHPGSVTSTGLPINPGIEPIVDRSMWIGGSDTATEGVWNWQTGPEAGQVFWDNGSAIPVYSNWLPGEPSNTHADLDGV